jgi:pimeloyl-ACP methyl ester carboxylesterase
LTSLTGPRFSSESAQRPFHYGVREQGGTILRAALPSDKRKVQADLRSHLIHRPVRDIIPPHGGFGHGNRQRWPGMGPLSLSVEASAIDDACSDGSPFHLIGHSYGGGVALKFALGHPERLRSLTLIEPSCFHLLKAADTAEAESFVEIIAIANGVNRCVICGDYRRGMATFRAMPDMWKCFGQEPSDRARRPGRTCGILFDHR